MRPVGLRIDVDTLRGTKLGVPRLLEILARRRLQASFFFTVGPDNMGRHAWRLLNPAFAAKMLRSKAPALYGWDILLAGLCWPGRLIGTRCADVIRAVRHGGHEIGLHAWDHHRWQVGADRMSVAELEREIARGVDALGAILGHAPVCSAAPGWKCNDRVLEAKQSFGFQYNSDCRGQRPFVPVVNGRDATVQIPTTLATYDEVIGRDGVSNADYNDWLLDRAEDSDFNVLTVHAEVEGIVCAGQFDAFLEAAAERGFSFLPLGRMLQHAEAPAHDRVVPARVPGRAGTLAVQASAVAMAG
jgi:undecaprenyl phosphate-alpha-L-ara4FN deformylase